MANGSRGARLIDKPPARLFAERVSCTILPVYHPPSESSASCNRGIIVVLFFMPPKLKKLIKKLQAAGFIDRGGKGSHRNFTHPTGVKVTLSGNSGDDAKPYQERAVRKALEESR